MCGCNTMQHAMPYDERNEDTGQFTPEFTDDQFIDAIESDEGATTSEVAEAVGCNYRTAYDRLNSLEESGRVSFRDVGNSRLWLSDE